ncbi:HEAT repeat domain-containing protein [Methanococcoides sp. AM1]|uniref:HEAT repeat domain-containing protein n=1 Tax=Methanococcoides sp. AM1 TaxID=1201011 RepID=UPI0010826E34|nr:HEAT repeat domain-containing protein [Methanococcoides sp. AM1]
MEWDNNELEKDAELLINLLNDESKNIRRSAAKALGEIGDVNAVEPLINLLNYESKGVRISAAKALGIIGDERAVEPLNNALKDESKGVRISAAKALREIESVRESETFIQTMKVSPSIARRAQPKAFKMFSLPEEEFEANKPRIKVVEFDKARFEEVIAHKEIPKPEIRLVEKETRNPTPRYADLTFFHYKGKVLGEKIEKGYPLQAEKWHCLQVAVREKPTGISFLGKRQGSIREPKQKQDVTVMVTAEAEDENVIRIEEPVQYLRLPPQGDSTKNAYFKIKPLCKTSSSNNLAKIRVRLYYEFNMLEVDVISAEVVGKMDDPTCSQLELENPVSFKQERLEREYVDFDSVRPRVMHIDISRRRENYYFTFAFYKALKRKVEFSAPVPLSENDLESDLVCIRKLWYDIALSDTFSNQVEGNKFEFYKNMQKLAKEGRGLWTKLFRQETNSAMYKIGKWLEKHPLEEGGIIQISIQEEASNFVFPWALLYDRDVAKRASELEYEGFWGLRYCIEQQPPGYFRSPIDAENPVPLRKPDEPHSFQSSLKMAFMLWEKFRNAKEQKTLMKKLAKESKGTFEVTGPITDEDSCYELLENCNSDILYFYTHGYTRHRMADVGVGPNLDFFVKQYEKLDQDSPLRKTYKLLYDSIKKGSFEPERSWIGLSYGKLYLRELYEHVSNFYASPLVILNMCESAQVTPSLSDSFIHFFLDRGACAVLGTECPMTVEFAHPFAEKFLEDILSGEEVGKVLLEARWHFVKLHNPLGLAYTLFGPATVCFSPPVLLK